MSLSRSQRIAAGGLGLVLLVSLGYLLFQVGTGALREDYAVDVVLGDLGQSLNAGNDVKMRDVRVGSVTGVEINEDYQAIVTLTMDPGHYIPEDATFLVTGKTLLGEKQVEIDFDGSLADGPFLVAGTVVDDPERIVEFEDVLATFAHLFEEIDPQELAVVVDEFIAAFEGMGPEVARSIDEGARAAEIFRGTLDDQVAGNRNLSLLASELAVRGQDFNRLGRAVEQGMPTISENQVAIRGLLDELSVFARVLDATLRGTRDEIDRMIIQGDTVLRLFYRYRVAFGDIFPTGLVEYSTAFRDGTGYEPSGNEIDGLAAYFQLIIDQTEELEELCHNLPEELSGEFPGCPESGPDDSEDHEDPESPLPELPLPGGDASAEEPGIDEDLDTLRQLPAPEAPARGGADTVLRNALGGLTSDGGER